MEHTYSHKADRMFFVLVTPDLVAHLLPLFRTDDQVLTCAKQPRCLKPGHLAYKVKGAEVFSAPFNSI